MWVLVPDDLIFSDEGGAFACDIGIVSSGATRFVGYRGLGLVLSQSRIRAWKEYMGAEYYVDSWHLL